MLTSRPRQEKTAKEKTKDLRLFGIMAETWRCPVGSWMTRRGISIFKMREDCQIGLGRGRVAVFCKLYLPRPSVHVILRSTPNRLAMTLLVIIFAA